MSSRPDFILVGPPKTGTTSLHYCLDMHPMLLGACDKEVHFFSTGRQSHWSRGLQWYYSQFPERSDIEQLVFESTPNYFKSNKTLERIKDTIPNVKIICTFRNPVDRFISQFMHFRAVGKTCEDAIKKEALLKKYTWAHKFLIDNSWSGESRTFDKIIESGDPEYFESGVYHDSLQYAWDLFGRNNVHVIIFDDLIQNTQVELKKVFQFLDVDDIEITLGNLNTNAFWKSLYDVSDEIKPDHIAKLNRYYHEHNQTLSKILDRTFNWNLSHSDSH